MLLPGWRVGACGRKVMGRTAHVEIERTPTGAHYVGVETCGSVWCCPVCAGRVAAGRSAELTEHLAAHVLTNGAAYMVTLTVRHALRQPATTLRAAVAAAWSAVINGAPWKRFASKCDVLGYVRALEVTHGGHGWHPHLHVLLYTARPLGSVEEGEAKVWLYERWANMVARRDLGDCDPAAFVFERVRAEQQGAEYLTKWGAGCEVTRGSDKAGRKGRSPWQLLEDADEGDRQACALFREYARAFHGARHLTWSRKLRRRYLDGDELDDDAVAALASEPGEQLSLNTDNGVEFGRVIAIPRRTFYAIVRLGLTADILDAAAAGGRASVLSLLFAYDLDVIFHAGLEAGHLAHLERRR